MNKPIETTVDLMEKELRSIEQDWERDRSSKSLYLLTKDFNRLENFARTFSREPEFLPTIISIRIRQCVREGWLEGLHFLMSHSAFNASLLNFIGKGTAHHPLRMAASYGRYAILEILAPHCSQEVLVTTLFEIPMHLLVVKLIIPHLQNWKNQTVKTQEKLNIIQANLATHPERDRIYPMLFSKFNPLWRLSTTKDPLSTIPSQLSYDQSIKYLDDMWSFCTPIHIEELPEAHKILVKFLSAPINLPHAPLFQTYWSKKGMLDVLSFSSSPAPQRKM